MPKLAFIVVAAAALLSSCGGGSSDQAANQAALDAALAHQGFVDQADRICTQGRKQLILTGNRYFGNLPPGRQPSDAAVTAYARQQAIPILRGQYARLRGLHPPPSDRREIDRILALANQGIAQLAADPTLLKRGNGIPPALGQARIRAFHFGLGACGQQVETPASG